MTLPAGFKYQVVVRPLGGRRLSVEKAVRFSGVYELREGRLVLVQPLGPEDAGFEWEIRGADELVLVAQPPVRKTGQNYLGATLKRLTENNEPVAPKGMRTDGGPAPRVPAAGGPARVEGSPPDEERARRALERIRAEYRLRKEPAYRAPPQYCLVLLGREPARLWLVSDGVTLYVDRNGNGDLTEPGEAVPFKAAGFASFFAATFPGGREGVRHTNVHIGVRQRDWEKDQGGHWAVRAEVGGRYPMYALVHKFARKPEDAPVVHLGGPLRMGLHELESGSLARGGQAELAAHVVCQYPGVEKAFVDVDRWQRKDVHPVAEVRLPARALGAEPVTLRMPLTRRC
jgi:hypothetical protein